MEKSDTTRPARYMLRALIVLFLFAMVSIVMSLVTNKAYASSESSFGGRTLAIKDGRSVRYIPNVPWELSDARVAEKLVTGEMKEVKIENGIQNTLYEIGVFTFPFIRVQIEYADKTVMYHKGVWFVVSSPGRFTESNSYGISLFFWIILLALVMVVVILIRMLMKPKRTRMNSGIWKK